MAWKSTTATLLIAAATSVLGCLIFVDRTRSENKVSGVDPETAFLSYKTWKPISQSPVPVLAMGCDRDLRRESGHSHSNSGRHISVYVSPNAQDQYRDIKTKPAVFPVGTVIVKEKVPAQSEPQTPELGIMIKQPKEFSPETGDWQYLYVTANGEVTRGESLRHCATCHENAKHDHVFGIPRKQE